MVLHKPRYHAFLIGDSYPATKTHSPRHQNADTNNISIKVGQQIVSLPKQTFYKVMNAIKDRKEMHFGRRIKRASENGGLETMKKKFNLPISPQTTIEPHRLQLTYESRLRSRQRAQARRKIQKMLAEAQNRINKNPGNVLSPIWKVKSPSKWYRPTIPEIKKLTNRHTGSKQKPDVKTERKDDIVEKIGRPPIARQTLDLVRVGQSFPQARAAVEQPLSLRFVLGKPRSRSTWVDSALPRYPSTTSIIPYVPQPNVYKRVNLTQQRYSPYTLVVRLSTGCSGTLITPIHVLTSAHCVHQHEGTAAQRALKVEVPETMGYRIHYVEQVYIPEGYKISQTGSRGSQIIRAMNDYAVIRLNQEIPGRREFPKFSAVNDDNFGTVGQIHIIGYPQNHYPEMWQSSCSVQDSRLMLRGRFLMSTCSSHQGLSGAAALVDNIRTRDQQMRLIGITSNMVFSERMMPIDKRLSVILLLNQQKISDICQQVGPFTGDLSSCV